LNPFTLKHSGDILLSDSQMAIEIVDSPERFATLNGEWNRLATAMPSPFLRHEWLAAGFAAYGTKHDLAVHILRRGDTMAAALPLRRTRSFPPRLELIDRSGEPQMFLASSEADATALLRSVAGERLALDLPRLRMGSADLAVAMAELARHGKVVVRARSSATARVHLLRGWEAVEEAMSTQARAFLRRKKRMAEREGPVSFEEVVPDEASAAKHLDEVFRIEASGWKARAGTALLHNPESLRFYRSFGLQAARAGILRIHYLRIANVAVAARLAVWHAQRLWELKIGYDEAWSRVSPGLLLTHESLKHACETGCEAFEFLGQTDDWQKRWPLEIDEYSVVKFFPYSLPGATALVADASAFATRRARAFIERTTRRREVKARPGIASNTPASEQDGQ
jgi:CelD/BcsL family acetyltransferase involved in cellulose biosynthesis